MDPYNKNLRTNASEAGILAGVEHFLKGLPDSVRDTLSAGEIADTVINMIERSEGELHQGDGGGAMNAKTYNITISIDEVKTTDLDKLEILCEMIVEVCDALCRKCDFDTVNSFGLSEYDLEEVKE